MFNRTLIILSLHPLKHATKLNISKQNKRKQRKQLRGRKYAFFAFRFWNVESRTIAITPRPDICANHSCAFIRKEKLRDAMQGTTTNTHDLKNRKLHITTKERILNFFRALKAKFLLFKYYYKIIHYIYFKETVHI